MRSEGVAGGQEFLGVINKQGGLPKIGTLEWEGRMGNLFAFGGLWEDT